MDENDFIVAIQAILTRALEDGRPLDWIVDRAQEAINEFEDQTRIAEAGEDDSDAV